MVAEPGRTMASTEERLRVMEQQGVENMKDIGAMEVRMQKVEKVEASMREDYVNVAKRVLTIESVVRRVPTGLLENWQSVEAQMEEWHRENKERKEKIDKIGATHVEAMKKMKEMNAENEKAHAEMKESICKINIKSMEDEFLNKVRTI